LTQAKAQTHHSSEQWRLQQVGAVQVLVQVAALLVLACLRPSRAKALGDQTPTEAP
jgi:hypothetical protein